MNPAEVFQVLGRTEPFFTVSSASQYRKRNMMSSAAQKLFWKEGYDCVQAIFTAVGSCSFRSILDYGCGIGRLLRCVMTHTEIAYGVDVSVPLLEKAAKVCPFAMLMEYEQWLASPPVVEFSYSVIVFQHIPEEEGLLILDKLLRSTEKLCAFHIVVSDPRPWPIRCLFHLSFAPFFAGLSNWLRARPWNEPRIPMFCWNIEKVKTSFKREGFELSIQPFPHCADPWESYLFIGKRKPALTACLTSSFNSHSS
jgi:hypothetical protein